jgi:hypothetical protein
LAVAAPPVVVECWCLMVATMDRVRLDKFTRETWRKFDAKDLTTNQPVIEPVEEHAGQCSRALPLARRRSIAGTG